MLQVLALRAVRISTSKSPFISVCCAVTPASLIKTCLTIAGTACWT
jgi:hypothetical protein